MKILEKKNRLNKSPDFKNAFRTVKRRYDESKYVHWVNAFEPINKNKAGLAQSWKLKVTKFDQGEKKSIDFQTSV